MGKPSRPASIPPETGHEVYSQWELHKLAVTGLFRACVGGLLGFPAVFVTDILMRQAGLASDSLGRAAGRVVALTFIVLGVLLYVLVRKTRVGHPFAIGAALMLIVSFFAALGAAPTGGFTSPYSFGIVPVLLTWALLMPGGVRYGAVPIVGGFVVYVVTLVVVLDGRFILHEAASVLFFQFVGVTAGVVCAEVIETWRRKLAVSSTTDALTGLMSRRYLLERLDELCAHRRREPAPVSVVLLDLDHFKRINDSHGHAAGDAVLRMVARSIRSVTREADLCGRIGGEELVVVLDACDGARAVTIAERIRALVETTPVVVAGATVRITLSAGIVTEDPGGPYDPDALLQAADVLLYESKTRGRNRVSLASGPPAE